jgi:hypothetical protein
MWRAICVPSTHNFQAISLRQAVEIFKTEFCKWYPQSHFLIDGQGYEDEDLDLNIYVDGDQLELERYAIEVSHTVQQTSGYFILPFIFPTSAYPTNR